jgi:hypothetical protein
MFYTHSNKRKKERTKERTAYQLTDLLDNAIQPQPQPGPSVGRSPHNKMEHNVSKTAQHLQPIDRRLITTDGVVWCGVVWREQMPSQVYNTLEQSKDINCTVCTICNNLLPELSRRKRRTVQTLNVTTKDERI